MALYIKRPLTDHFSNDFLESKGFILLEDVDPTISKWAVPGHRPYQVRFSLNTKVACDDDLYYAMYRVGQESGARTTKWKMQRDIQQRIQNLFDKIITGEDNKLTSDTVDDIVL